MADIFTMAGQDIALGQRRVLDIEVARLYDFTDMAVPVEVVRGKVDGPTLFVTAAVHGDEINGVEIIRRLLHHRMLRKMAGTLIAVPIVNVYGFNDKSRYLPDRRDLNRCFPGNENGSLAAQLAYSITKEIIRKADYGIDLHTGAIHRSNFPQIRGCIDDAATLAMAKAFGVPVIINAALRDGSLRQTAQEYNVPTILYEAGESLRFNGRAIKIGVEGVLRVMQHIGMLPEQPKPKKQVETFIARFTEWVRAPHSGILLVRKKQGDRVKQNEILGVVSDPFGRHTFEVRAPHSGIIVGYSLLPLVNEGDALFHIATFENVGAVENNLEKHESMMTGQVETFVT